MSFIVASSIHAHDVLAVRRWVAKYRRDDRFAGKPSYSNMYSVLNAISGHYNSFGPEAPIPKKRLDRITKELADAEKLLARDR
jgi:photosystem II Psb27 protein